MKKSNCLGVLVLLLGFVALYPEWAYTLENSNANATAQEIAGTPRQKGEIDAESKLKRAYQREFAFLSTQREGLVERLKLLKQRLNTMKGENAKKIGSLQSQLLMLKAKIDSKSRSIQKLRDELDAQNENTALVELTKAQALETLKNYGFMVPDYGNGTYPTEDELIREVFDRAILILGTLADTHVTDKGFFLPDGKKVHGQVIDVGAVSSYGISKEGIGSLIPAGGGYMRLWVPPKDGLTRETALFLAGKAPEPRNVGVFLYEDRNKEVIPAKAKGINEIIKSGGVIGYIIISLGFLAVIMLLIRGVRLLVAAQRTRTISEKTARLIRSTSPEDVAKLLKQQKGVAARVLLPIVENINKARDVLEYMLQEKLIQESARLEIFKNPLNAIAIVSPLLGLLGTVSGIIKTFDVIVEYGTGNPKLMAGGISEALVTTELGLMVAIPVYIFANLLAGWEQGVKESILEAALKIMNVYHIKGHKADG